jgi:hypothetical protein
VLILDEMNLSHVERYFADLLSAIESGEPMTLHSTVGEVDGVPPRLHLPVNLFTIGTINVDETTYLFSPKVLDRANVIEFYTGHDELAASLRSTDCGPQVLTGAGEAFARSFVDASLSDPPPLSEAEQRRMTAELLLLFDALAQVGAEFGFRTAKEMARFIAHYGQLVPPSERAQPADHTAGSPDDWLAAAIDAQIMHKLLPRLNGARGQLAPALWTLAALCSRRERPPITADGYAVDTDLHTLLDRARREEGGDPLSLAARMQPLYPMSSNKLARMWRGLEQNGFTSFMGA